MWLQTRGLERIGEHDEPTHNRGGVLDLVFSNLIAEESNIIQTDMSDHTTVRVTLKFKKNERDVDLTRHPKRVTQKELRM